jgi:hypothetical protein
VASQELSGGHRNSSASPPQESGVVEVYSAAFRPNAIEASKCSSDARRSVSHPDDQTPWRARTLEYMTCR